MRQPTVSASRPPMAWPRIAPRIVPFRNFASEAWRWPYGTVSPTQAIDSGMIAAASAPVTRRASSSAASPGASAHSSEASAAARAAPAM